MTDKGPFDDRRRAAEEQWAREEDRKRLENMKKGDGKPADGKAPANPPPPAQPQRTRIGGLTGPTWIVIGVVLVIVGLLLLQAG